VDFPQSENASVQTSDYDYIEQDGGISNLSLKEILSVGSPSSMEIKKGSITFEKNG
jgi:hypothetical protein